MRYLMKKERFLTIVVLFGIGTISLSYLSEYTSKSAPQTFPTSNWPWLSIRQHLYSMGISGGTILIMSDVFYSKVLSGKNATVLMEHALPIAVMSSSSQDCPRGPSGNFYTMRESSSSNYWLFSRCNSIETEALPKFPTMNIRHQLDINFDIIVPDPSIALSTLWNSSTFVDCIPVTKQPVGTNHKLTTRDFSRFVRTYNRLIGNGIVPFLFDGTLLGWIRHCDLIEHTTDFDIAVFSETVGAQFIDPLKSWIFPMVDRIVKNDQKLLQVTFDSKTDLFLVYSDSNDRAHLYIESIVPEFRQFIRNDYLNMTVKLCTSDMRGHLFYVPCQPLQFVVQQYGADWVTPRVVANWYDNALNHVFHSNMTDAQLKLNWTDLSSLSRWLQLFFNTMIWGF